MKKIVLFEKAGDWEKKLPHYAPGGSAVGQALGHIEIYLGYIDETQTKNKHNKCIVFYTTCVRLWSDCLNITELDRNQLWVIKRITSSSALSVDRKLHSPPVIISPLCTRST